MTVIESSNAFMRWTQSRTVTSFGTNDGAPRLAFQSWHHFKEAFPPELIKHAIDNAAVPVSACLDPFGGSGTTALACQMLGVHSTTIEVNPFLADVIRAKLANYDVDRLVAGLAYIRLKSRRVTADPLSRFGSLPRTFLEPGVQNRWIFDMAVARRLSALLDAIDLLELESDRRLFQVIVGGLLAQVSNVRVSGKGRRYRKNWRSTQVPAERVDSLFAARAERAILDVQQFSSQFTSKSQVIQGDSRAVELSEEHQLAIFSPPYPNSFDYTDVYNLELWMLGYLRAWEDNKRLRTATLASHVQLARTFLPAPAGSPTLDAVCEELDARRSRLWSRWIPSMVGAYFSDLLAVLDRVRCSLSEHGQSWIVVGDSSYSDVAVPVAKILNELVSSRGWNVSTSEPFRHMKSSAQQGWRPQLAESLLVLQKE